MQRSVCRSRIHKRLLTRIHTSHRHCIKLIRALRLLACPLRATTAPGSHVVVSIMAPTTRSQTRNLLVSGQPFETPRGTGATLDAIAARWKTVPQTRLPPASSRAAAVLAALFEDTDGRVCVVLTRRSNKLKTHSGEVCLPGGKRDEEDADDVACALREAHEELGLDPSLVEVLATMPTLLSSTHV